MDLPRDLADIRRDIDAIDEELIALLSRRQSLVEAAGVSKRDQPIDAVRAPARVEAVIAARRRSAVKAGLDPDVAEAVWRAMIDSFIRLESDVHARGRGDSGLASST